MEAIRKEEQEFLSKYHPEDYERPSLTVDITLLAVGEDRVENYRKLPKKKLRVLLIKREDHPYKGCWALPGVFATPKEGLEEAALRGLKKETGVDNIYLEQLYTVGTPGRDPRTWVVTCAYMALVSQNRIRSFDNEPSISWFDISMQVIKECNELTEHEQKKDIFYSLALECEEEVLSATICKRIEYKNGTVRTKYEIIENNGLAFDHAHILVLAIERLRGKIEYSDISFQLVPEKFTLTELQNVYETVLGTELLPANFRRKMADKVEETEEYAENAGHRPSKLFKRTLKEMSESKNV